MTNPIERGCEISVHVARPGRSRRAAIVAPQLSVRDYALRLTRPGVEERRNAGGDARPTPVALLLSLHREGEQMPARHLSSRISCIALRTRPAAPLQGYSRIPSIRGPCPRQRFKLRASAMRVPSTTSAPSRCALPHFRPSHESRDRKIRGQHSKSRRNDKVIMATSRLQLEPASRARLEDEAFKLAPKKLAAGRIIGDSQGAAPHDGAEPLFWAKCELRPSSVRPIGPPASIAAVEK